MKDTALIEPFFLRLFSVGNVVITTGDETTPTLVIPAVAGAGQLREQIRRYVEERRAARGVRIAELE